MASGDPFGPLNVTRLRIVAAALYSACRWSTYSRCSSTRWCSVPSDLGGLDPSFRLEIPWVPMLAGLVVAMLAEAFKAGSRLRDDVDGLV